MKKILLMLFLAMTCASTFAQGRTLDTRDYLKIVPAKAFVAGAFDEDLDYFDVELVGADDEEQLYTTVQMDIILPEGFNVYVDDEEEMWVGLNNEGNEDFFPKTKSGKTSTWDHKLDYSYGIQGERVLRAAVWASNLKQFKKRSGSLFYVYTKTSNSITPGNYEVRIENVKFIMPNEDAYIPVNQKSQVLTVSGNTERQLNVNSANKWSTCILPFSTSIPDGVSVFTCSEKKDGENDEDKVVVLTPVESMEAYTPYILYSENGFTGTLKGTVDAENLPVTGVCTYGLLNGAIVPQTITQGYVLQNLSEGVKFYNCGGQTFSIRAGKCWLSPDAGSAKSFAFEIADPTGIKNVNTVISDNSVYTLDGKKVVNPLPKSIYIKSGKKFISK